MVTMNQPARQAANSKHDGESVGGQFASKPQPDIVSESLVFHDDPETTTAAPVMDITRVTTGAAPDTGEIIGTASNAAAAVEIIAAYCTDTMEKEHGGAYKDWKADNFEGKLTENYFGLLAEFHAETSALPIVSPSEIADCEFADYEGEGICYTFTQGTSFVVA